MCKVKAYERERQGGGRRCELFDSFRPSPPSGFERRQKGMRAHLERESSRVGSSSEEGNSLGVLVLEKSSDWR